MSGDEPTQTGTTYIGQPTNPTNTLEWYSTITTETTIYCKNEREDQHDSLTPAM